MVMLGAYPLFMQSLGVRQSLLHRPLHASMWYLNGNPVFYVCDSEYVISWCLGVCWVSPAAVKNNLEPAGRTTLVRLWDHLWCCLEHSFTLLLHSPPSHNDLTCSASSRYAELSVSAKFHKLQPTPASNFIELLFKIHSCETTCWLKDTQNGTRWKAKLWITESIRICHCRTIIIQWTANFTSCEG